MMRLTVFFVLSTILLLELAKGSKNFQGHLPSTSSPSHIRSALPRSTPPKEWNWDNVNGVNYLTLARNQHLPLYCGSCWAHAVTSSLSDRIKIARKAAWPDINIAPQVLVSCGPGDGCHGGYPGLANKWMHENDITDETCSIYRARGHDNGLPCSKFETCENCMSFDDTKCFQPKHFYTYRVDEYGPVEGDSPAEQEANMRAEIFHRGPIACGIAVPDSLMNLTNTAGVYKDTTGAKGAEHDISVVGYGVDPAEGPYWLVRNSWGNYWGNNGFFRVARGINNIGIEGGNCVWATPKDTWTNAAKEREQILADPVDNEISQNEPFIDRLFRIVADFIENTEKKQNRHTGCVIRKSGRPAPELIKSPLPSETIKSSDVPDNWDWRNVNGTNFMTWNVNQHIPHYCGSCWAQGTVSALADRFSIADHKKYANLALSAQSVVNCHFGGTCHGGNPMEAYDTLTTFGIPDWTCQSYTATDTDKPGKGCKTNEPDETVCKDCGWPPAEPGDEHGHCWAKKGKFLRYRAKEWGRVNGAENMKKEIYARGPIACGVHADDKFVAYTGGIYSEKVEYPEINHELSVVGFGKDPETGEEYWIGRNSWGTYWGEYGFFRIKMYKDNLNIEFDCAWAMPDLENF